MGCILDKTSTNSPSQEGLEKLKLDGGYVKGGHEGRPINRKQPGKDPRKRHHQDRSVKKVVAVNGGGEAQKESDTNGGGGGNVVKKVQNVKKKNIEGYELVNGWPKWLVDNIPGDVLAGLVPKSADSYEKLAKIGHGTYSNVYKARDRDTGKVVALKKVRFDTSDPESIKFMAREIMMLQRLDHPNVIKLEGLATSRMQYSLYLVFDFMQSDLARIINCPGLRLTEPQVKCYMQQLLSGLQHCHERGILHRDIKASNLLIDKNGMLKIADFGLANFFPPQQRRPLTSRVVTLWYRAPELLLGSTDYGVGIDLWSAGCLLPEMFTGKPLMPGRTEVEQLHKIFKLCGSPPDDYWRKLRPSTSFRPQNYKPSFEDAFKVFPSSSFGLLTKLLALDPESRGTAASSLQNEFFTSYPLACELSALPVMYQEEAEPIRAKERKKHHRRKVSKSKQSRTNLCEVYKGKEVPEQSKADFEPSNKEKFADLGMQSQEISSSSYVHSQEMNNSESSTSSSTKPNTYDHHLHHSLQASLSPILRDFHQKRTAITEGHPNALKNINPNALRSLRNFTLLQASITDIINHKPGINATSSQLRRSISTLDFRNLDPEKLSSLFASSDKE
ncbi:hypothetical protein FEM48_Zijuj08G0178700 [Ziziphus jujuba var. spinosa]|uniref:Protein kinase domain-containing protein n=1 Tax=Ziziphus jujuba var. spinosa TaxID=714518 RepID=A0A978V0I5_ZIZJJ|nr:hypothetical protein FEM48_Zijuj08G0178700 [Ziziphus jujuba var. spinosa]